MVRQRTADEILNHWTSTRGGEIHTDPTTGRYMVTDERANLSYVTEIEPTDTLEERLKEALKEAKDRPKEEKA